MKECNACNLDKPFSEYYSGRGKCKACIRLDRITDTNRLQKYRDYRKTPKGVYGYYKSNAKTGKKSFKITYEEFLTYWQKPCHYCGSEIEKAGLDRVDNTIGYELTNIVSCCSVCNMMKKDLTVDIFYSKIYQIINHKGE